MPFIETIEQFSSVSIVGMEKNTGKTECLNYILRRLKTGKKQFAVTSIGLDGEGKDQVFQTDKPEIEVFENMIFCTSEKHYRQRHFVSEIVDVSEKQTALGRLVTAKAREKGKILLSGPADTYWLKQLLADLEKRFSVNTTLVDGALSRKSLASPAVTQAMILTTGAAYSSDMQKLVQKTQFTCDLIHLEEVANPLKQKLESVENGIWSINPKNEIYDLGISSVFALKKENLFEQGTTLFVTGAINDSFLDFLRMQKEIENTVLIIKDFTKAFISPKNYKAFLQKGGKIKVVQKTKLLAVCINPTSPGGYCLDSHELKENLQEVLQIPVYDVKQIACN